MGFRVWGLGFRVSARRTRGTARIMASARSTGHHRSTTSCSNAVSRTVKFFRTSEARRQLGQVGSCTLLILCETKRTKVCSGALAGKNVVQERAAGSCSVRQLLTGFSSKSRHKIYLSYCLHCKRCLEPSDLPSRTD